MNSAVSRGVTLHVRRRNAWNWTRRPCLILNRNVTGVKCMIIGFDAKERSDQLV